MAVFTTGEAVALELPIARIPTRAAAFLIDVVIQLVLGWMLLVGVLTLVARLEPDLAWLEAAMVVTVVTVLVGYPTVCETLLRGRTLGKLALGLRVVRGDGGPIDFRHAITRGLAGAIVDFWMLGGLGAVAVVTSLCSPRARRVGDILAGTVVVHDRARIPLPALAAAPPWLLDWAQQLDLSGLSEDLALPVRQYLTRFRTLTPEVQTTLGHTLVTAVCTRLRTTPPPGYPPLHILGAVIAERQRRTLSPLLPAPTPQPIVAPSPDPAWQRPA
ncbi:RDD family protein [Nocardia transvalensis]|uniref:RDD family protein n=1 Tax=Nocardia transvalensis TaxID=37333 RepID=UPI001894A881|nr:RDD family protein [Nocardia transvalensis]MBF6328674.1 RDD family protein [Nocardia transvalensis]